MRIQRHAKGIALCSAGMAIACLGGISLAGFADNGTFAFYKERPKPLPQYSPSQPVRDYGGYPIDPGPVAAAPPITVNPIDALYRDADVTTADLSEPAFYTAASHSYVAPASEPVATVQDPPELSVSVTRGSWAQPAAAKQDEASDVAADESAAEEDLAL
ncbi:MAG: hypothetical protein EOP61_08060 [Sphingomonadales bacterium]|nr:MAG: hypothetical protein EOP61_08060 [Sphingomonadales bacterium]